MLIILVSENFLVELEHFFLQNKTDFNFPIVNFPFISSNIPAAPAYGVYISQLIRYSRACSSYQDFIDRGLLLTRKPLNQGFLRKFYGRHHDLVDRYGISDQKGNQNPYIEEEQTTHWLKIKGQKVQQRSTKHTHRTKDLVSTKNQR
jgi:hypothetical protein